MNINTSIKEFPNLLKNMGSNVVLERFQKTPIPTLIEFTKLISEYEKDVENITCPTLTIRGTIDKVVPIESTNYVYDNLKSKTNILINIDNVTHDCFRKNRNEEIKEIITKFLRTKQKQKKETLNI